jgi:hypothetical protein
MDANNISEMEMRELVEEESEKVAGGRPSRRRRHKLDSVKRFQENDDSVGHQTDDGSVSGSGSW